MADFSGLTRNIWTGTWSSSGNHPIVIDSELRGALRFISGDSGDQLTDIPGQRLEEGMLVYVKNSYTGITGDKYYQYKLQDGESRNVSTGEMPNSSGNWTEVTFSGGVSEQVFTTSSTNEVVIDTLDINLYRSAKYEMQVTSSSMYSATELRLLHDNSNLFLSQYATVGDALGTFASYYSPAVNNYSAPNINNGGLSYWNSTTIRIYTTSNSVGLALLSATPGTALTLNGSVSATLQTKFTEISSGIFQATTVQSKSPILLLSTIAWSGSGSCELRFTPVNSVTTLKYIKTVISA